ncbi:hypothetical protein C8J57DRAFT_322703 [Mycena rebaudengoi]|nr:hypothetical protein C8J57DRAFT_322703 [Mycena rebaudengoi]
MQQLVKQWRSSRLTGPPNLLPELEIHIFQLLAQSSTYNRAQLLCLMLVARRVRVWVEPFMYKFILFSNITTWSRLQRCVKYKPGPSTFLANRVKSICLPLVIISERDVEEILSICTGVERVAFWTNNREIHLNGATRLRYPADPSYLRNATPPPSLRRLSIELSHFLHIAARFPSLQAHLTHLELVYLDQHSSRYPGTIDLTRFVSLTHVALQSDSDCFLRVPFMWSTATISSILRTCPSLQMLVLLDHVVGDGVAEHAIRTVNDPRVVKIITDGVETLHLWEPPLGEADMWERGDHLLRHPVKE